MPDETVVANPSAEDRCPKCGSGDVRGLVASFWVPLDADPFDHDWQSESDIGPERYCNACECEWDLE